MEYLFMDQVQLKEKVLLTLENDKRTVGCGCRRTLVSQSRCNLKGHSLQTIVGNLGELRNELCAFLSISKQLTETLDFVLIRLHWLDKLPECCFAFGWDYIHPL